MSSELQEARRSAYFLLTLSTLLGVWENDRNIHRKIQGIKAKLKHLDATATIRNAAYYIEQYEGIARQAEEIMPSEFEWKKHDPLGPGQGAYLLYLAGAKIMDLERLGKKLDEVLAWAERQQPIDFYAEINNLNPYERYTLSQQLWMSATQQSILYALVALDYDLNFADFLHRDCSYLYDQGSRYLKTIERTYKDRASILAAPAAKDMIAKAEEMMIAVMSVLRLAQEKLRLHLGKEGVGWTDELWEYSPQAERYMNDPASEKLVLYVLGNRQMQVDKRFLTGR